MIWWHRLVLRHELHYRYGISVPYRDPFAKGILVRCSCRKSWAL